MMNLVDPGDTSGRIDRTLDGEDQFGHSLNFINDRTIKAEELGTRIVQEREVQPNRRMYLCNGYTSGRNA